MDKANDAAVAKPRCFFITESPDAVRARFFSGAASTAQNRATQLDETCPRGTCRSNPQQGYSCERTWTSQGGNLFVI
jgi:hypothetical protein